MKKQVLSVMIASSIVLPVAYAQANVKVSSPESVTRSEKLQKSIRTKISLQVKNEGKVVTSKDGKSQIRLPPGWMPDIKAKDADQYQIQVTHPKRGLYLSIATQPSQHKPKGFTLQDLARLPIVGMKASLKNSRFEQTSVKKVNSYPAAQYKLQGVANNGADLTFLSTVVETPRAYYVVLAGSTTSAFKQYQGELQAVIQSFQEVNQ